MRKTFIYTAAALALGIALHLFVREEHDEPAAQEQAAAQAPPTTSHGRTSAGTNTGDDDANDDTPTHTKASITHHGEMLKDLWLEGTEQVDLSAEYRNREHAREGLAVELKATRAVLDDARALGRYTRDHAERYTEAMRSLRGTERMKALLEVSELLSSGVQMDSPVLHF